MSHTAPKWHWKSKSECGLLMRQPGIFRVRAIESQWPLNNWMLQDRWEDKEVSSVERDKCHNTILWINNLRENDNTMTDTWAVTIRLTESLEPGKHRDELLEETPTGARSMAKPYLGYNIASYCQTITMAHQNAHVFFCIWQVINNQYRDYVSLGSGSHGLRVWVQGHMVLILKQMNGCMTGMCPAGQYSWPNVTHQHDHKLTFEEQDRQGHYTGPVWLAVECNHSRHLQMRSSSTYATAAAMSANINYAPVLFACLCPAIISVLLFLPYSVPQGGWSLLAGPPSQSPLLPGFCLREAAIGEWRVGKNGSGLVHLLTWHIWRVHLHI